MATPTKTTSTKTTTARGSARKPVAPKKPQDRKPPAPKKKDGAFVGEVQGIEVSVPMEAFEDFETMEILREVDEDPTLAPRCLRILLGDEQFRRVMDYLRDKDTGKVSVEDGVGFLSEVFEVLFPNS